VAVLSDQLRRISAVVGEQDLVTVGDELLVEKRPRVVVVRDHEDQV
jgi:hypothetical protein